MKLGAILLVFFMFAANFGASAQCAMCRAVTESDAKSNGFALAEGLNNGILYLMIIPYILLFILFRKKIIKFFKELSSMR